MRKQFPMSDCSRGAPMGRESVGPDDYFKQSSLQCFRVEMSGYGCYDDGGAYWGQGMPLYCVRDMATRGNEFARYIRASSRAKALEALQIKTACMIRK